jgi:hypothetical protein
MLTVENEHSGCPSPSIIHKVTAEVPNLCGREDKGTDPCLRFVGILPGIRVNYSTKVGLYKPNWMC